MTPGSPLLGDRAPGLTAEGWYNTDKLAFAYGVHIAVVAVDRASDILAALKFAEDNNIRLVVRGGAEAWMVAPQLAAQHVPVILDPRLDLPQRFESLAAIEQLILRSAVSPAEFGEVDSAGAAEG